MSFKTDRARFKRHAQQPNGWKFARYKMANYFHGQATIAASAGDLAEQAAFKRRPRTRGRCPPPLAPCALCWCAAAAHRRRQKSREALGITADD